MKIKQLRLQNIKSYQDETILFYDGVNFISGINGAGKSTIIESIGFALFDCKPGTISEFVRYGAKSGTITVEFAGGDGRPYKVVRKVGSVSSWVVYDGETGSEIDLHGASDVKPWLKDCLGVEQDQDLAQLFNDVVGVSQGTFTAPFLETPSNRKQKFNKMLKVESYNEAYGKTREAAAAIVRLIEEDEKAKVRLEERVADYAAVKAGAEELAPFIRGLELQAAGAKAVLATKITEREDLRQIKTELEQTSRKAEITKVEQDNAEKQLSQLQENLAKAEEAVGKLSGAVPGYQAYLAAQKQLAELEKKRQERDRLTKRLAEITTEVKSREAALKAEEESIQGQLQETTKAAEGHALQFKAKEAQVRQAQAQKEELQEIDTCLSGFLNRLKLGQQKVGELSDTRRRLNEGLEKWASLTTEMEEIGQKLADEGELRKKAETIKALEKELEAKRIALAALEQKLNTLQENQRQTAGGQCPFLHSPCQNVGGDLHKYFAEQIAGTREKIELDIRNIKEVEIEIQKGQQFVQGLQDMENHRLTLKRLETEQEKYLQAFRVYLQRTRKDEPALIAKEQLELALSLQEKTAVRLKRDIHPQQAAALEKSQQEVLVAWEQYCTSLKALAEVDRESIDNLLQGLNHVMQKVELFLEEAYAFQQAFTALAVEEGKARSASLGKLTGEQQALEKQLQDLHNKLQQLEKQRLNLHNKAAEVAGLQAEQQQAETGLMNYRDVEERIAAQQDVLTQTLGSYETYMQHQAEAKKAEVIKIQVQEAGRLLETKKALYQELHQKAWTLAESFNEEKLAAMEKEVEELQIELAKNLQLLEERSKKLLDLQERLLAMEKTKGEIVRLEAKIAKHQAAKVLLEYIRSVFNRAGERVAAVYREYLAYEANRLYREVSRENVTLEWGDDYEVSLADSLQGRKRERSFRQLSGGEQMTAALAVRLALLGQLSGVKLGFFDEPTTNLDGERRSNLAQIIPQITGDFDQLFVISHDDSFDAMTDNIIQLRKDQGTGTKLG